MEQTQKTRVKCKEKRIETFNIKGVRNIEINKSCDVIVNK